jgi:hypothetical protein
VTRVPIACSLSAEGAQARVEDWQRFLSDHVAETARTQHGVRLRLQDGDDAVLVATDLARQEKACCPFFEFRLVLLPEAVWLEVDTPDDAGPVLELFTLRTN